MSPLSRVAPTTPPLSLHPSFFAQFRAPLDKAESHPLFALLQKYRPESAAQKKERLAKQGAHAQYTLPSSHHRLLEAWKMVGDTVARFVQERTVVTQGAAERTRFQPLYEQYEKWSRDERVRPVAKNKFGERLKALGCTWVKPDAFVLYNLKLVDEAGAEGATA